LWQAHVFNGACPLNQSQHTSLGHRRLGKVYPIGLLQRPQQLCWPLHHSKRTGLALRRMVSGSVDQLPECRHGSWYATQSNCWFSALATLSLHQCTWPFLSPGMYACHRPHFGGRAGRCSNEHIRCTRDTHCSARPQQEPYVHCWQVGASGLCAAGTCGRASWPCEPPMRQGKQGQKKQEMSVLELLSSGSCGHTRTRANDGAHKPLGVPRGKLRCRCSVVPGTITHEYRHAGTEYAHGVISVAAFSPVRVSQLPVLVRVSARPSRLRTSCSRFRGFGLQLRRKGRGCIPGVGGC
jgi:hypothetical protein